MTRLPAPGRKDLVDFLFVSAIENGCFAAICTIAASEWEGERFAGAGNHVFDPHGDPVRTPDDRSYVLDRDRLKDLVVDPVKDFVRIDRVERFGD